LWIFPLLLAVLGTAHAGDTLRFFNPKSRLVYYRDPAIVAQATRFEAPKPLDITGLIIDLAGDSTGHARVHIYGQEGGLPVPLLEHDLVRSFSIRKSHPGLERIVLPFATSVHIAARQFFVVIDSLSPGVVLLSDNLKKRPACSNGIEEFQHQFLKLSNGQWRSGIYAFAVEAIVEYAVKDSKGGFRDVTAESKILDSLRYNASIAWADVDNDARLDLLVDGRLYHNAGDGTILEITDAAGLTGQPRANAFIDIDNDARPDILFLGSKDSADHSSLLYRNNGDGTFTRTQLALPRLDNPTSFSIADADGDGYLDLFVGQMSLRPEDTLRNYLLINDRRHGFVDRSSLLYGDSTPRAMSAGSQWIDYDNDGHPDLYVAAYSGRDELWKNNGDTSFVRVDQGAADAGAGSHEAGCDWADYDNDGNVDLLSPRSVTPRALLAAARTSRVSTAILTNAGAPDYDVQDRNAAGGIEYVDRHAGGTWGDADNDGLLDALITTSCDCRYAALYRQRPDHQFEEMTTEAGLRNAVIGPDAVWVDYDNDGRLDIATLSGGRFRLLRNTGTGENNSYVELDLSGSPVGSRVTLYTGNGKITRQVTSGRGLLMQPALRLHFGLANSERVDSVVVDGPGNRSRTYTEVAINGVTKLDAGATAEQSSGEEVALSVSPNPFTTSLHFAYELKTAADVHLVLYTVEGREVVRLVDGKQSEGSHDVVWDGRDGDGLSAAQGAYIYRFTSGRSRHVGSVVLTR
jgi:hypothetical protein